ncbi:DUF192 domain-containing protein [Candidatus Falkowbacteria bacterium]|jgi:uncharacterized protein|nr:DUF192 domain-containing protein [Candidatus Falkowbacteria bacterium]MBT4433151.1 DUF192 domain-containing protein [Candidatus Falkowbacteria bacterium]
MKKTFLLFLIVILFSGCGVKNEDINTELKIGDKIISIETVDTFSGRRQGLSGRDSLCQDCGLFFVFDEKDTHIFWMKDMKFPIDIIWIDDNTVVEIAKNAEIPSNGNIPSYTPSKKANKVLEVNAGFCEKYGIKVGETVKILTEKGK